MEGIRGRMGKNHAPCTDQKKKNNNEGNKKRDQKIGYVHKNACFAKYETSSVL